MRSNKTLLFLFFLLGWAIHPCVFAASNYESRVINNNTIHIVTLNPQDYHIRLVKSHDGKPGRESVPDIAKRTKADIAINGGFFEMKGARNGMPTGTLVIDGKRYGLKNRTQGLLAINANQLSIHQNNPKNLLSHYSSLLSGIPLLIKENKILPEIFEKQSSFYTQGHARTAVGKKTDGSLVIVVAEALPGLSLPALAELMKSLECHDALNLDGGGSSTLWMDGKVVNQTLGDIDESEGLQAVRAVSDAIVFTRIPVTL